MNIMPVTEFDNLLRDQYEQASFEYKPANWERLSSQLPDKKKKPFFKKIFWLPLSAAAAVAAFIVVPRLQEAPRPAAHTITIARMPVTVKSVPASLQVQPAPAVAAAPATIFTASGASSPAASIRSTPIAKKILTPVGNLPVAPTPTVAAHIAPVTAPVIIPSSATPIIPVEVQEQAIQPAQAQLTVAVAEPTIFKSLATSLGSSSRLVMDVPQYDEQRPDLLHASSLSIAGGYKYGTANMGYMIGFNGRRSLSDKIFIEGDLAFANNRNAQVTNQTSNEIFDQVKTVAGTNAIGARALSRGEVVSNMYYLQLTPTIGYQVFKTMSLGAGADVQRMFRNNESTLYIMDGNDVKALPQMDYGIVGKVEYSLTKIVKAGIQYRQGMNNMLSPDKNYLNRSYIQVQLKLGILGK
jgi:hypothetical protein